MDEAVSETQRNVEKKNEEKRWFNVGSRLENQTMKKIKYLNNIAHVHSHQNN